MRWRLGLLVLVVAIPVPAVSAELGAETLRAWEQYVRFTEARIDAELESNAGFQVMDFMDAGERAECRQRLSSGDLCTLKRATVDDEGGDIPVPNGMVHHWYGAILVPDVGVEPILELVQSYGENASIYEEVEDSRLLSRRGSVFEVFLRLKRKKILTVHYNTNHEVTYRTHSERRTSSRSLATRIREIRNPGEASESEKPLGDDRGFLWGLNSYWRFEETPDGTVVEVESVSLSRSVPLAARWLVRSYIDSVPRESIQSTLEPLRDSVVR
jgi:hypothetical protein